MEILEGMPRYITNSTYVEEITQIRFTDGEKAAKNFEGLNMFNPETLRNAVFRKMTVGVVIKKNGIYKCSCCKKSFPFDERKPFEFCPMCGAAFYQKAGVWNGESIFAPNVTQVLEIPNVEEGGLELLSIHRELRNAFNETAEKQLEDVSAAWGKAVDKVIKGLEAVATEEDPT